MTYRDYNVVMKTVRIAELKARLSEHLKWVRKGRTLTVLDRDTPVARIVPYAAELLEVRRATRRLRDSHCAAGAVDANRQPGGPD